MASPPLNSSRRAAQVTKQPDRQPSSSSKRGIVWTKKPEVEIAIPTTRQDMMFDLAFVWSLVKDRHGSEKFQLQPEDKLRVFSQNEWALKPYEERRHVFREANVLIKHDRSSPNPHPTPICPGITRWSIAQLSQYVDLTSSRFMQEQSWASDRVRERKPDAPKPIPRYELMDDGKANAIKGMLGSVKLKGPTFPTTEKSSSWSSEEPKPRCDVTLADARNAPDLRLRNATLLQFLKYMARHRKEREERDASGTSDNPRLYRAPAVVNFLDIALSGLSTFGLPTDGLFPFPNLQSQNHWAHFFGTEQPHTDFKWALCASAGAVSDAHMDAGGFATFIRVLLGRKLWFIGIPSSQRPEACVVNSEEEKRLSDAIKIKRKMKRENQSITLLDAKPRKRSIEGKEFTPYISAKNGFQIGALRWVLCVLEPGDDL